MKNVNTIMLSGMVLNNPKYSHANYGKRYYSVRIVSTRYSGIKDCIDCTVPEYMVTQFYAGCRIGVIGTIKERSDRSNLSKYGKYSHTYVSVKETYEWNGTDNNLVTLTGYVCKPVIYRMTPLKKAITDIKVEHFFQPNHSSDVFCIAWFDEAERAKELAVGDYIVLDGRLQSRVYRKKLSEYEAKEIETHEVCIYSFDHAKED